MKTLKQTLRPVQSTKVLLLDDKSKNICKKIIDSQNSIHYSQRSKLDITCSRKKMTPNFNADLVGIEPT